MKCQICGKNEATESTTFHYNKIDCNCCSNGHAEVILHCKHCVPHLPSHIHPEMKDEICGNVYTTNINNILPDKIEGQFIIEEPVITDKVFKWHPCFHNKPLPNDEPGENDDVLIACETKKLIFYMCTRYQKGDWITKAATLYNIIGWTHIQRPAFV